MSLRALISIQRGSQRKRLPRRGSTMKPQGGAAEARVKRLAVLKIELQLQCCFSNLNWQTRSAKGTFKLKCQKFASVYTCRHWHHMKFNSSLQFVLLMWFYSWSMSRNLACSNWWTRSLRNPSTPSCFCKFSKMNKCGCFPVSLHSFWTWYFQKYCGFARPSK